MQSVCVCVCVCVSKRWGGVGWILWRELKTVWDYQKENKRNALKYQTRKVDEWKTALGFAGKCVFQDFIFFISVSDTETHQPSPAKMDLNVKKKKMNLSGYENITGDT